MRINEEVRQALAEGRPVVALESTIVAHGMPRPINIETALAVESIIRNEGAIPASVGLINGEIVCGLTQDELTFLAYADDVVKAQERDLARASFLGKSGATTVGATLFVAHHFGIHQTLALIEEALARANSEGINGKRLTPYLLSTIYEISEGASLAANVALIKNNAYVGAQVARALSDSS